MALLPLQRTTWRLNLTQAGEAFASYSHRFISDVREAEQAVLPLQLEMELFQGPFEFEGDLVEILADATTPPTPRPAFPRIYPRTPLYYFRS